MTTVEARPNGGQISADGEVGMRTFSVPAGDVHPGRAPDRGQPGPPPAVLSVSEGADELRTLRLVRRSRTAAVWLTVGIAAVSFVLSFNSLRSLAAMTAWPGWPSWLSPLLLDGLIILATLGIVSLAPYRDQFRNRVFLWA